jgi:tRNA (adenine37-N6)-methyltransferase
VTQRDITEISFRSIGYVSNDVAGPRHHEWGDVVSDIIIDEHLAPALDGIEQFSHVVVLFYIAGVSAEGRSRLKLHPRDRDDAPLMGVFATHSQFRPNPIGLTVARVLERQGNRLRVQGLDAYNGTPILDIKNYVPDPEFDANVHYPDWVRRGASCK